LTILSALRDAVEHGDLADVEETLCEGDVMDGDLSRKGDLDDEEQPWITRLPSAPRRNCRAPIHRSHYARTTMKITFLGAVGTVTGSKYLVETDTARVLVDCGLFQGGKELRERNWARLEVEPQSLNAVVLTHAHIDHSGYLPRLVKAGFDGPVYCTPGTEDLLRILLPDSGHLQEEDARYANKRGWSKHRPALPLYTRDDALAVLSRVQAFPYHAAFQPAPGIETSFGRAGHIVGSAWIRMVASGRSVTFTGDVGRPNDPVMRPPEPLLDSDALIIESTYGDRQHPNVSASEELGLVLERAYARGGAVVVPAFAVGRAQHLLYLVSRLVAEGRIPRVPVFLDSPMAIDATKIFCSNREDHGISDDECHAMCHVAEYSNTAEQSKAIDARTGPMLVISASGMATGGRILHHLARFLPDEENTVILVGYQASGTRGRSLAEGARELKIHGDYVPVRAHVEEVASLSAHADHVELVAWLTSSGIRPRSVFVTHGEPIAAEAMRRSLVEHFGWNARVPRQGDTHAIEGDER
jgi:metallo-beta-lactamase family protein